MLTNEAKDIIIEEVLEETSSQHSSHKMKVPTKKMMSEKDLMSKVPKLKIESLVVDYSQVNKQMDSDV